MVHREFALQNFCVICAVYPWGSWWKYWGIKGTKTFIIICNLNS